MSDSALTVRDVEAGPAVETAATAVAARERAAIEARYIVALRRPRNIEDVRARLLHECERTSFAKVARYKKPVGGKAIEGLSVRFAESAIRLAGNIHVGVLVTFDDLTRRTVRVSVTDLETNSGYEQDITIEKTVERRGGQNGAPPRDREVLGKRTNTNGETVFLVAATEDEFMNKQNALISKALRNHGLRLLPGDILDECEKQILETMKKGVQQDPDAEKRKILDAFAEIGVLPSAIEKFLGHGLEMLVEAELIDLRAIYQAIRDGEVSWQTVMDEKFGPAEGTDAGDGDGGREKPRRRSETNRPASETKGQQTETKPPSGETTGAETTGNGGGRVVDLDGGSKIVHPPKQGDPPPAPRTETKPDFELVSEITKLTPKVDEKHGKGASKRMLDELYGVSSAVKLAPDQARDFIEFLKRAIAA